MKVTLAITIPRWIVRALVPLVLLWRKARYGYEFRRIGVGCDAFAIVDPADYNRLAKYQWQGDMRTSFAYPTTYIPVNNTSRRQLINMHSMILCPGKGLVVDHINSNPLDNRRSNLRLATPAQNARNCRKTTRKCSSKYKGVTRAKGNRKYTAAIRINYHGHHLGYFDSEEDAARAYDAAAKKLHREFARLNFPETQDQQILTIPQTIGKLLGLAFGVLWVRIIRLAGEIWHRLARRLRYRLLLTRVAISSFAYSYVISAKAEHQRSPTGAGIQKNPRGANALSYPCPTQALSAAKSAFGGLTSNSDLAFSTNRGFDFPPATKARPPPSLLPITMSATGL